MRRTDLNAKQGQSSFVNAVQIDEEQVCIEKPVNDNPYIFYARIELY